MKNKNVGWIVAIVIVAVGGFYGGMKYASSQTPTRTRGMMFGSAMRNGSITAGEIVSKDDTSITLKLRDGSSKIVFYSTSTGIQKTATGTPADLTVGEQVAVTSSQNQGGSLTAQSIQIRPAMAVTPSSQPLQQ